MPILDFKEISIPTSGETRDQFELFARECLEFMGFKIVVGPDRGPDAGRDLIVEEIRTGIAGETRVRWLVSCKHKAHSGVSVTPDDESDIHDRVRTHQCKGFLAFYSTVPSSGLATKLNAADLSFEVHIFDSERIENRLLSSADGALIAQRFFPLSFAHWKKEHPTPAKIFRDDPELLCLYCNKSLLVPKPHGIVVLWRRTKSDETTKVRTEHVYWSCKGQCDSVLRRQHRATGLSDAWEDIADLIIPIAYIRWVVVMLNEQHSGEAYSDVALETSKQLLLNLFPLVSRHMTDAERERIERLGVIPEYLGGWGYES